MSENLINQQAQMIPDDSWIGIDDIVMTRNLSEGLKIQLPGSVLKETSLLITEALTDVWGQDKLVVVHLDTIRKGIGEILTAMENEDPRVLTVSMDPDYYPFPPYLHISRLTTASGKYIGYGPRPGSSSISDQIVDIAEEAKLTGKKEIFLVDDFSVTGGTIQYVRECLRRRALQVSGVVLGIVKKSTVEALASENIRVGAPFMYEQIEDAACFRDLIPAIPRSGLLIGTQNTQNLPVPLIESHGMAFRPPYIAVPPKVPFEVTYKWAGIPVNQGREFSIACWTAGLELHAALVTAAGRDITLGGLVKSNSGTGFPGLPPKHMENGSLNTDKPVVEIVEHKLHKLLGFSTEGVFYSFP